MSTFAILASGPSMSLAVAEQVRGRCRAIAVSDSHRLAPWADALVAQDWAWWEVHKEAKFFAGRKFCGPSVRGGNPAPVERLEPGGMIVSSTNSGLLACLVAAQVFGATRILLLGMDFHGSHFFGPHPKPLNNTSEARFDEGPVRAVVVQGNRGPELHAGERPHALPVRRPGDGACGHG
jgi:hypothetical protein